MKLRINQGSMRPFYRGLPVIVLTTAAALLAARKYLKYAVPQYESTAKIKLADIHEGVPNSNLFKDFDVFVNTTKIDAEVELLKSRVLVRKTLARLNMGITVYRVGRLHKEELYDQSPLDIEARLEDPHWYDQPFILRVTGDSLLELEAPTGEKLHGILGHWIETPKGRLILARNGALLSNKPDMEVSGHYQFTVHSEDALINQTISRLDVMSVDKDVPVLRISYKCPVPQEAADVVNTLSSVYIEDYVEQKYKSADTTEAFLNQQLQVYGNNLRTSEDQLESYEDQHRIVNLPQETETDLRKIADLKKELASVQMDLNAVDTLNRYIDQGQERVLELAPNFEAYTDLLSTELVKKIKELQRDRQDLLLKYTPEDEKVKVIDDKLRDINHYLKEGIQNTANSLRVKYDNLQQSITEAEGAFTGLPTKEKNMTILDRNFGLNDEIYRFLHKKRTEAEIAKAATLSFHRVISEGEVPMEPVAPKAILVKILACILGMLSGVLAIYTVHSVKARVNDADTVSRLTATPLSAGIPRCKTESERRSYFRRWALELELKGQLRKGSIVCVSSYDSKEGRSYIAGALAEGIRSVHPQTAIVRASTDVGPSLENPVAWKKHLDGLLQTADVLVIDNFAVRESPVAPVLMASSTLNFFTLDSRRTRKMTITEADILQEDLAIPGMEFILNRAGYTPSLLVQVKQYLLTLLRRPS